MKIIARSGSLSGARRDDGALLNPALAHETRLVAASVGKVQMSVGFHIEPALLGTTNANDTFLYTYDKPCTDVGGSDPNDFVGAPIDVNGPNGDTVNLKVERTYSEQGKALYSGTVRQSHDPGEQEDHRHFANTRKQRYDRPLQ